jgi:hypothetical protein
MLHFFLKINIEKKKHNKMVAYKVSHNEHLCCDFVTYNVWKCKHNDVLFMELFETTQFAMYLVIHHHSTTTKIGYFD